MKPAKILFFLFAFSGILIPNFSAAGSGGSFNAGEMIMHHVQDAHEIHLLTIGDKHISIPLPIIVNGSGGMDVFSSSEFYQNERVAVGPEGNEVHYYAHDQYIMVHEHIYEKTADKVAFDASGNPKEETARAVLDLSITKTVAGIFICVLLMFFIFGTAASGYKKRRGMAPKGLQSLLEPLILFVRDEIAKPSIGPKYEKYVPFLLNVFFFIWIANLLGLIPFIGGFNVTGNIAITLVLSIFTFIITSVSGNKDYWMHIFWTPGVPWWLKVPVPLMPLIELMGMFTKPIVLTLRLFANITAGHIIILSFVSLIFIFNNIYGTAAGYGISVLSVAFSVFMNFIEILVAFLQAYVFTLLSALYFGAAVEEHHKAH